MPRQFKQAERLPFVKARELADDGSIFYIVGVQKNRKAKGRFPEQVVFIVAKDKPTGERSKLTLATDETREELKAFFEQDPTDPIGPCKVEAIEANTPSGFYFVIETLEPETPKTSKPGKRARG